MKAYIVHDSPLGTDYCGEGMYALITEKEEVIYKKWCSSRVFANHDLTVWIDKELAKKGVMEIYSNGVLVWQDGKLAEGVASAFLAEKRYYELINRDMKFNSQICTSREQSERLLALGLKKETADMCHFWHWETAYYSRLCTSWEFAHRSNKDIPAWSLGRLIELMPTTIKSRYGYVDLAVNTELVQYQYYDEDYMHNVCCQHFNDGTLYDNIIDCIEWLIKEGYFNKEYLV